MAKRHNKITIPPKPVKIILNQLDEPVIYSPKDYGLFGDLTGKGVTISVIDTGCPLHIDISKNVSDHVNFVDESKTYHDDHGHATMVSGVLGANNRSGMVGIAPGVNMVFGKVAKKDGECDYNAIVAAILWSIVKKVDIILMSMGTPLDYVVLKEAIKKAHSDNICVIAADGNRNEKLPTYPAAYDEVLSFKAKPKRKGVKSLGSKNGPIFMSMPSSGLLTTFGKKEYARVYGSSIAAAMGAGLVSLVLEKYKTGQSVRIDPNSIYSAIRSLKLPG